MRASILELESRSHYQVFDCARDQHLPWHRSRFHPGPNMHGNPTYVVAEQLAFTILFSLGYSDGLAPEAEIAAAVEVARGDFDPEGAAA